MPRKKKETEEVEKVSEEAEVLNEELKEEKKIKKSKLDALKEKAKALETKFEGEEKLDLKKETFKTDDQLELETKLVPIEDYLKASIHLGTRVITPDMKSFVYKRRNDGLAVFNTLILDEKIKEAAEYLAQFAPEDIVVVCKREAGWSAVKLFAETLGIKSFTKKYPTGILTNPNLETFIEKEIVFICDPWLDKNALTDALNVGLPILAICDTNNYTKGITKILPGNNKSPKSFGIIFYLMTKIYAEKRNLDVKIPAISEFVENWENLIPPK
jgi:small subunit ribosomal protein S2